MNKQLRNLSRVIFGMFIVLFFAVTMIQFVNADELRAHEYNGRTVKNSYKVERGSILVDGDPVAYSTPTDDAYQYARQYPLGALYAPVTGYYSNTQGMTGLERAMNQELSGLTSAQFFTRLARTLTGVEPQGSSVETTLNGAAQQAALEAMGDYEGAVVALDPSTGAVLAMVSTPSFDPALLSSNNDAEIITNYRQLEDDATQPLVNRAIAGDLYHPGSTFKLVTVAAALESGTATPDTLLANPAQFTLPQSNAVMQNASRDTCGPGDQVSVTQAIIFSCNIPMAELAIGMERNEISSMAEAFGFGEELEIPLPVTPSSAPIPGDAAQAALTSIGQLDVRATPLQMAMVSAGIANDGALMKPYLVDKVIAPDLQVEQQTTPELLSNPVSPETAQALTQMMELTVSQPDGTAHLSAIPDVRVAGKTGTAENGLNADGSQRPYTLWYTGFAPVEDPQVAIAVVIANGGGAAQNFVGNSYELPTVVGKRVMEAVLSQ